MTFFETIESWDRSLFLLINGAHNSYLDVVMSSASNALIWAPLYIFLLYTVYKQCGIKILFWLIFAVGILIFFTDRSSVELFKNVFLRYRPCKNIELAGLVHLGSEGCGGQYGFVSSHATNFFGIAVFMGFTLRRIGKNWLFYLLLWAALIGYSRIYLGKHYPADILGGALLGSFIGYLVYIAFLKFVLKMKNYK